MRRLILHCLLLPILDRGARGAVSLEERSDGRNFTASLVVTHACNMRCSYCTVRQEPDVSMSLETASKIVDYVLGLRRPPTDLVWSFTGGEPLLEVELIAETCRRVVSRVQKERPEWLAGYRFLVGTNGTLYCTPKVQDFIEQFRDDLRIDLSLDGIGPHQDRARRLADGTGTYGLLARALPLWIRQFPGASARSTVLPEDLPHLYDSVVGLWQQGVRRVECFLAQGVEWRPGDDVLLEAAATRLADYLVDNHLEDQLTCSLFSREIGHPYSAEQGEHSPCALGRQLAFDCDGRLYPCHHFMPFYIGEKSRALGDVCSGPDRDRLRGFLLLTHEANGPSECTECPVATGCPTCPAVEYAASGSRVLYLPNRGACSMHKARVRANHYYQRRLADSTGVQDQQDYGKRHLYIVAAEDAVAACSYSTRDAEPRPIPEDLLATGLGFAVARCYRPVVLQSRSGPRLELPKHLDPINVVDSHSRDIRPGDLIVYDQELAAVRPAETAVLRLEANALPNLAALAEELLASIRRVNVVLPDAGLYDARDISLYRTQLRRLGRVVVQKCAEGQQREVNLLTDPLLPSPEDCGAGTDALALGPNGLLYACPGFYHWQPEVALGGPGGSLSSHELELCKRSRSRPCNECHLACSRCLLDNMKSTATLNVPGRKQCLMAFAAHVVARSLGAGSPMSAPHRLVPGREIVRATRAFTSSSRRPKSRLLVEGSPVAGD